MKKLSDYKDEEALELWADLLEPAAKIFSDRTLANIVKAGKSPMIIASAILKRHKEEATSILLRIDPAPIDGLNIIVRLMDVITDMEQNEDLKSFFGFAEQAKKGRASSGSPTGSIEDDGK